MTRAARPKEADAPRPLRDLRDAPAHQLAILARLSNRKAQADFSARYDVTLGEWSVLAIIKVHAPVTLVDLSQATLLDKGQLSRTVQRLVQRGWVESRAAPRNRGAVHLSLTAAGRALHAELLAFAALRNEIMMSVLTPAERDCFVACIDKLRAHMESAFDDELERRAGATPPGPRHKAQQEAAHPATPAGRQDLA